PRPPMHRQVARLGAWRGIEPPPQDHSRVVGDGAMAGQVYAVTEASDGGRPRGPPQPADGDSRKGEEDECRTGDSEEGERREAAQQGRSRDPARVEQRRRTRWTAAL